MIIRPKITQGIIEDVYVCHKNSQKIFQESKTLLGKEMFLVIFGSRKTLVRSSPKACNMQLF